MISNSCSVWPELIIMVDSAGSPPEEEVVDQLGAWPLRVQGRESFAPRPNGLG